MTGTMEIDQCYSLQNVVVRQFNNVKYLSMAKTGSAIKSIDNIGEVIQYDPDINSDQRHQLSDASIIAITSLDTYKSCLGCKARVETTTPLLGRCTKCSMMQRVDKCPDQLSAKMMLQEQDRSAVIPLSAFGSVLHRMAHVSLPSDVTQEALLEAPPFETITYNSKGIITAITR